MEDKYLRPKYLVTKIVGEGFPKMPTIKATDPDNIDSPFVLMPRKDPAAFLAMLVYAEVCDGNLAAEIRVWLRRIAEAPLAYGTQGMRNHTTMKIKQLELS